MLTLFAALLLVVGNLWGADVILNEYNAVDGDEFLNGGDAAADEDGGRAGDSYFGRILGNGGDWFELVVIKDHLDMRGWKLEIFDNKLLDETLDLTGHPIWSDLRAGTIITVSEDVPSDVSYNPAAGDWWINVQANDEADGLYIEASSFRVSSDNWQLRIRNGAQTPVTIFGPAGEGIAPSNGIGNTEVCRLEEDPSASVTATNGDYDDGKDFSTFGSPNRWGAQNFSDIRPTLPPAMASIRVTSPSEAEIVNAGDVMTIRWETEGAVDSMLVEFSIDGGGSWLPVYPPNVGNTGQYKWLAPLVDSDQCLVRVSSSTDLRVHDICDNPFTIVQSVDVASLTLYPTMSFLDLARWAPTWLD